MPKISVLEVIVAYGPRVRALFKAKARDPQEQKLLERVRDPFVGSMASTSIRLNGTRPTRKK
jgi:hypothetical protein